MSAELPDLERFVRGEADPARFPHREHVRMAFEMLRRHDFAEAVLLYSRALRAMTVRAGKPEVFNQTVTIAFLALIGERMHAGAEVDFAAFARDNSDLFEKKKEFESVPILRNMVPAQVLAGNSSFNTGNSISAGLPNYARNRLKAIAEILEKE